MNNFSKRCMTIRELFSKEVINTVTAERLGYICDAEVDVERGQICLFYINPHTKGLFSKKRDMKCFGFCDIQKIGRDTILIKSLCRDTSPRLENEKKSCKSS